MPDKGAGPETAVDDGRWAEVIVDCHEPMHLRTLLEQQKNIIVRVEELDVDDYVVGPEAVVERKSGQDFVSSIIDGRYTSQALRMQGTYRRAFWLIEGDPFATEVAVTMPALASALARLATGFGASLLRTDSPEQTAALLAVLARDLQAPPGPPGSLRPGKPRDANLLAEFIVSGLPGVGPMRARALLARFGSVEGVFTASAAEIAAMRGFGPRTAGLIRAAIEARYQEALARHDDDCG